MPTPLPIHPAPTPYWRKFEKLDLSDFEWNLPEQPLGSVLLIGGNAQTFSLPIRLGEFLTTHYPIKDLHLLFPDALAPKLSKGPRFIFASSTPSGSLGKSPIIEQSIAESDATLILGDLSKHPVTAEALITAAASSEKPLLLTRDTVDLLAAELITCPRLILVASLAQLQKLFRALYYPKVLMLSAPILPVVEALHKFTLSYPVEILTFHEGLILGARGGKVQSLPLSATSYTPLSLWQGQLATKYFALTFFNPSGLIS